MVEPLIGIEIGGSKLQIVTGAGDGRILHRHRFRVDSGLGATAIRSRVESTLGTLCAEGGRAAIGVGFGGPVDWRSGQVCCSHQVGGWSDFPLGPWLSELTGLPVEVDNDANTAALGEAQCGSGHGYNPVFYVTLGSGVGGGLVVDGRIYHGAKPGEAEIGHLRLDRQGTIVEARCSGWAVDAKIRALQASAPSSVLARLAANGAGGEAKHLATALEQGDGEARRILEETAGDLAFALSHVVHLFHPAVILLGGGLALVGNSLSAAVAGALPAFVMDAFHPVPGVALAGLGEDAVPTGALLLAARALGRTGAGSPLPAKSRLTKPANDPSVG